MIWFELLGHNWSFKVISELNIRKSCHGMRHSYSWPKRNSAYFASVCYRQNFRRRRWSLLCNFFTLSEIIEFLHFTMTSYAIILSHWLVCIWTLCELHSKYICWRFFKSFGKTKADWQKNEAVFLLKKQFWFLCYHFLTFPAINKFTCNRLHWSPLNLLIFSQNLL